MELRDVQRPIKERYRAEPDAALIHLSASARQGEAPVACSVGAGAAIREAQAHLGVGVISHRWG
ncbi:MAG TPA: hypothetical protein VIL04_10205 [Solirubrobacterales bacterium]|jgi:acyl-CoA hydrolase